MRRFFVTNLSKALSIWRYMQIKRVGITGAAFES